MNHYVYLHKRKDNGIVFYVGKGRQYKNQQKYSRAFHVLGRSKTWDNYVKDLEYEVVIVKEYENSEDAFLAETELMKRYGFVSDGTGTLINQVYSVVKTYQYDRDGNFLNEYNSFREASRLTKTNLSDLQDAYYGRLNGANGFQWKSYKFNKIEPLKYRSRIKSICPILQMDEDFNIISEWISLEEIKRCLGIGKSKIYRSYKNHSVLVGGYKWIKKSKYESLHIFKNINK